MYFTVCCILVFGESIMFQYKTQFRSFLWGPLSVWQNNTFYENNSNRNKIFLENYKNIFYTYTVWQNYHDKIKTIAPDTNLYRNLIFLIYGD